MFCAADTEILDPARQGGLVIVTLDADFHAWLAVNHAAGPLVIRLRRESLKGPELADLLESVLGRVSEALASGALVTTDERTIRVKHLPITSAA